MRSYRVFIIKYFSLTTNTQFFPALFNTFFNLIYFISPVVEVFVLLFLVCFVYLFVVVFCLFGWLVGCLVGFFFLVFLGFFGVFCLFCFDCFVFFFLFFFIVFSQKNFFFPLCLSALFFGLIWPLWREIQTTILSLLENNNNNNNYYYYYYYYYLTHLWVLSLQRYLMIFHWSLSESKRSQISRTLLSILADLTNAVVWKVSTRPFISKSSSPCTYPLVIAPSASITIGVTGHYHVP